MALLVNNLSIISDLRLLDNITADNTSIHAIDRWTAGTNYSRGSISGWSAGTTNLRTETVQPTTNDFSEAILYLNCDLITSGAQTLSGLQLQFGTSRNYTLMYSHSIGIGSKIIIYIKAGRGSAGTTLPQLYLESYRSVSPTAISQMTSQTDLFIDSTFDFDTDDMVITWGSTTASGLSWNSRMWWR